MCSPASFETAYVQRASPTEPMVDTWPSRTLYACVPKTSLVEKSMSRSSVFCVATAASSTLYVPIRLTRIVCIEHVRLVEREVGMVGQIGRRQRVAVEVVERDDLVLVDELSPEGRRDEAGATGDEDAL